MSWITTEPIARVDEGQMHGETDIVAYHFEYAKETRDRKVFLFCPTKINNKWHWLKFAFVTERKVHIYYKEFESWNYAYVWVYRGEKWEKESHRLQ